MFMQLMDRNPELAQLLNNPSQLQEAMQAASNPVSLKPLSMQRLAKQHSNVYS